MKIIPLSEYRTAKDATEPIVDIRKHFMGSPTVQLSDLVNYGGFCCNVMYVKDANEYGTLIYVPNVTPVSLFPKT